MTDDWTFVILSLVLRIIYQLFLFIISDHSKGVKLCCWDFEIMDYFYERQGFTVNVAQP